MANMTMSTDGEITASDIDQEQLTTKVYYYMDDQPMPFATEIPVPPSKITLFDFKQSINKKKYKFYHKVMDPILNTEVKTDILDDKEILRPNSQGLYELFLLSDNNVAIAGTSGRPPIVNIRTLQNRASVRPMEHGAHIYPQRHRSHHENLRQANQYFDDSSSQEESNLFMDSNVRMHSDDESRYSTDITSVSQQPAHNKKYDSSNKPCWARDRRRRPKKSYHSFLSTTFDDTQDCPRGFAAWRRPWPNPGFSGFPEAINPGRIDLCRRDRYQSSCLAETKRLTIFRISGSHKSRQNRSLSARPVPIVLSRRDEVIDVSHARNRAAIRKLAPGQIQDFRISEAKIPAESIFVGETGTNRLVSPRRSD
ncbi:DIX domain-containing protein [Ditylenchus destructor]|uniref:DIX domain-containing protein n=1 Tax=Ditylenchus destructor TaxID=166010 RepID=A0AAD4N2V7_9BILA|nr:DIX domain-containing protein [Ditylenchus destructor]